MSGEAGEAWLGASKSKWGKGKAATERAAAMGGVGGRAGGVGGAGGAPPGKGKGRADSTYQEGQWSTAQTTYSGAASSISLETANAKSYEIFIKCVTVRSLSLSLSRSLFPFHSLLSFFLSFFFFSSRHCSVSLSRSLSRSSRTIACSHLDCRLHAYFPMATFTVLVFWIGLVLVFIALSFFLFSHAANFYSLFISSLSSPQPLLFAHAATSTPTASSKDICLPNAFLTKCLHTLCLAVPL